MSLVDQLNSLVLAVKLNVNDSLYLLGSMWAAHLLNIILGGSLNILGIRPRTILGLPGIIFSPWLHGSFDHLFYNSIPLFVLFVFMLTLGTWTCLCATVTIILLSGTLTWLLGRNATHIGASSLIMGYLGFVLTESLLHKTVGTVVIGAVAIYYFGTSLLSILPTDEAISYEGHLFGLISGVIASYYGCIWPFTSIAAMLFSL